MKKIILLLLICANYTLAKCEHLYFKLPIANQYILCNKGYVVGYNTQLKAPLWSSTLLTPSQITTEQKIERNFRFKLDERISPQFQPKINFAYSSRYDRGHLTNYDDLNYDYQTAKETFLMTNVVPQDLYHNRGIWRYIESKVRVMVMKKGPAYIMTGPIYNQPLEFINEIPIPNALFKIIVFSDTKEIMVICVPNQPNLKIKDVNNFIINIELLTSKQKYVKKYLDRRSLRSYKYINTL